MADLRTNYKDDILSTAEQGTRKFNIVDANGNVLYEGVHLEDVSNYLQVGDEYGADEINAQNEAINNIVPAYQAKSRITTENLNDITDAGLYLQGSSANCTIERNYPCAINGSLEVCYLSNNLIVQKYTPNSSAFYTQTFSRRKYNGTWSDWFTDDYVILGSIPAQTIPTTGATINVPKSVALKCRKIALMLYGALILEENSYSSSGSGSSSYTSFTFVFGIASINTSNRIRVRWNGENPTTATIQVINVSGDITSASMPSITLLGKLGRNYPTLLF